MIGVEGAVTNGASVVPARRRRRAEIGNEHTCRLPARAALAGAALPSLAKAHFHPLDARPSYQTYTPRESTQ